MAAINASINGPNSAMLRYFKGFTFKHEKTNCFTPSDLLKIQVVINDAIIGPSAPSAWLYGKVGK